MSIRTLFTVCILFVAPLTFAVTTLDSKSPELELVMAKLDKVNYLPLLMPIIIKNKDFIGLTQKQLDDINVWRKNNKEPMIEAMQKIVSKRIEIQQAALSPTISSSRLIQMQNEIFQLQREVLEYKLSCREQIMKTFNDENWISFFMVLADEGVGITIPLNYAGK
ncbi:MAG: hypothetical protein RQ982_11260 [Gammaproteobacteria bacterium]|nr:hypothetical protein [Gammaproteobacteria bacterium]